MRVLVAFALLLSVSAPLVQYACGVTGETTATSTLVAETAGTDATPCGVISDGVHDLLCDAPQPAPVCEGDACTTDTVEGQSVVQSETSSLRVASVLTAGALPSEGRTASRVIPSLRSGPDAVLTTRTSNPVPVRLRTLSFRL